MRNIKVPKNFLSGTTTLSGLGRKGGGAEQTYALVTQNRMISFFFLPANLFEKAPNLGRSGITYGSFGGGGGP